MAQDDTNSSCSAGDPLDVMRNIIDREIFRLEESIRALRFRRNELSPIYRLPAEILCNIFSLTEDLSRARSPKSWTNFSQVSQRWRSSALSAPDLWTKIPLSYPRWAQEMLIRSKMAKMTIRSDLSFDKSNQLSNPKTIKTIRSCLFEMNRVEEINFKGIPGSILEKIFRDLPKSAPQLHTLCIDSARFAGTAFSIHEDFLHDTERLRCVELINCKISWDSRLLTGLTRLTLKGSLKANSSIIEFLHALQQMPALINLYLEEGSIPDDSEGPSTYPVVNLPCIEILGISSGVGPLTTVLRHITFPLIKILNLTCRENQSTQIDFSNFLSFFATEFLSSLIIRNLGLRCVMNGLEFQLWTTAIAQDCYPALFMISLVLIWPSSQPHNHMKVLTCAFDAMSLPLLTQIQISNEDYMDFKTWVKIFGKLPLLEEVWLQCAPHSFLGALVYKRKAAEKSKTAYHNVSFPSLRAIHLENTDFSGTGPRSISVDMLLNCLMERCERRAEVQALHLQDCYHISSDDVERLKEVVVDVIWDGVDQGEWEEDSEEESEGDYY